VHRTIHQNHASAANNVAGDQDACNYIPIFVALNSEIFSKNGNRLIASYPGQPGKANTRKVKPVWI